MISILLDAITGGFGLVLVLLSFGIFRGVRAPRRDGASWRYARVGSFGMLLLLLRFGFLTSEEHGSEILGADHGGLL